MKKVILKLRSALITGFFILLPIGITLWVVLSLLAFVNNLILPYIRLFINIPDIPGIGVFITLLLVLVTGLLAQNYFGKKLFTLWDKLIAKIPLVRAIYSAIKQMLESLLANKKGNFKQTVLVEFPRKGMFSIGFVANELKINGEDYLAVYVPTAPNPTSGYTVFVKKSDVINTNMTIDEATKIILSGGLVVKKEIDFI